LQGRSSATPIFETGIKVIDILSPLPQGEKSAMFRADGVGKTVVVMELIEAILVDRPTYMGERRCTSPDLFSKRRRCVPGRPGRTVVD